jgi:Cu/Ag efflux pump CusA
LRSPQLYATLIVILAALPLFFLGGIAGAFSQPAVIAYIVAVLSSTVVALTVAPALAFMLLRTEAHQRRTSPLVGGAYRLFDRTFPAYVRRSRWAYATLAVLFLVLAAGAGAAQLSGGATFASQQDRSLLIHWESAPGTSLPEMVRITSSAMKELGGVPGVDHIGAQVGRAITSDQVVNVNSGQIWITLSDGADYDRTVAAIQHIVRGYPGLHSDLATYPRDRVRIAELGASDPVVVRIYGADLDVLRSKAEEVRQRISGVQGIVQPHVQTVTEEPTLEVRVNLQLAQKHGINPGDVRRTAATYFSGLLVGNLYQEQKVFDVVVRGTPSLQTGPASLDDMMIDTPSGDDVRLGDIAEVRVVPFPTVIRHDATQRSLDVTAGVGGRDLGAVLSDVRDRVAKVSMPLEYHAEVLSSSAERQDENVQTALLAIGALIGIFLLLQASFGTWRLAAVTLLVLPLSVAGGVLVAFFAGGITTVGALLGLFAVLAIAVRNSVVVLSSLTAAADLDSITSATRERAGSILLAAAATIAVLIPLVFIGSELLRPLASVVIGGLVTSTLLTVFVLPALYLRLGSPRRADSPHTVVANP